MNYSKVSKNVSIVSAGILFFSSIVIDYVYKKTILPYPRLLPSLIPFYALFVISLSLLLFLLKKKQITIKRFFLLTLASEIAILIPSQLNIGMHYVFSILAGIWLLTLGYCLVLQRHKRITQEKSAHQESRPKSKKLIPLSYLIFLAVIILAHFYFGFFHLDKEAYTDEKLWTYGDENRIEKYWNNIKTRDWDSTRPSDKPGVTLAIISGTGLLWDHPSRFHENTGDKRALLHMLFVMRLPIVIFGTLMLLAYFFVLKKLTGSKTALIAITFIGLSPILIGISHIINPDALIYIFMPLALFSYLIYEKEDSLFWLYLTGVFLGLGLLTKYISNLLIIFFLISIFTNLILKDNKNQKISSFIREKLLDYATIIFIAFSVFYVLFPGVWVKLSRLLIATIWSEPFLPIWKLFVAVIVIIVADLVFFKARIATWVVEGFRKIRLFILLLIPIIFVLTTAFTLWDTYARMPIVDFQLRLSSPKSYGEGVSFGALQAFASGFYALIFSISPLAALGMLAGLILSIWNIIKRNISWRVILIWQITFFCMLYYSGSAISLVGPIIRYQIAIYPLILTVSSIGLVWLFEILSDRFFKKQQNLKTIVFQILLFFTLALQLLTLWNLKPYFFSYSSSLLPDPFIVNPKDMGDGNYQIAEFLNSLPDAKNLNVWSDDNGVCALFVGKCNNAIKRSDFIAKGPNYDYYIVSTGRMQRATRPIKAQLKGNHNFDFRLDKLYEANDYVMEITPGNRRGNFVRIIPGKNVTVIRGAQSNANNS